MLPDLNDQPTTSVAAMRPNVNELPPTSVADVSAPPPNRCNPVGEILASGLVLIGLVLIDLQG
jgi:hypothetical protein